jgi:hypothetical protein
VPATVETLKVYLGIDPASIIDVEAMGSAVAAANDQVRSWRPDLTDDPATGDPLAVWPPRADQAALVYSARLYGRRGSVQGIAAFQDVGVSMLPRLDPDVRALLELGEYQRNVVA